MDNQQLRELLDKYIMDTIRPEEAELLIRMIGQTEHQQEIQQFIDGYFQGDGYTDTGSPALRDEIQARLQASIRQMESPARVVHLGKKWIWAAAAIVLAALTGGIYLYRNISPAIRSEAYLKPSSKNDLPPGGNKAILTLSNGEKIILDSAANGFLVRQGSAKILKLNNGQLAYNASNAPATSVAYNTLSTPTGGQYRLLLPDGTKIWLDAASSITYPSSFTGAERKVEVTGQAYMEVAKNEKQPFIVQHGKMQVLVLGTHFNVNAYEDEATVKTTLVEGLVKVANGQSSLLLRPGQQAALDKQGNISLSEKVDTAAVLAWKEGMFHFKATDIGTVMRQVARWYDVTVQYEGGQVTQRIHGMIPRTLSAANMFKVLEAAGGVHFKIDGKKVVVMP